HRHTTHRRADAQPALCTGLAQLAQGVLDIAHFADGGAAVGRDLAHFARAQAQRRIALLARHQLAGSTGTARQLRALARLHLHAVHQGTDGHVAQRQRIADLDRHVGSGHHLVTDLDALRRDDVAALAIDVAQQGNMRGAVRIVLDPFDTSRNAFLVTLVVDDAVVLLVATTMVPR